jgi:hypothetical protein
LCIWACFFFGCVHPIVSILNNLRRNFRFILFFVKPSYS